VAKDGRDLLDSSDEASKPDEEFGTYAEGSTIKDVRLIGFETFLLRHQALAGGLDTVSGIWSNAPTPAMFE
jgi:hypothetical protein